MKTLTVGTLAKINAKLGTEPIIIVKVDWVTGTRYYADKDYTINSLSVLGLITSFSSIQGTLNERSFGQVQSASITLCDIDGHLKTLFDDTVVEQRSITVYHHFVGTEDLVPVLIGKLVSPIEWSEGDRSLKFEINAEVDSDDLLIEIKETDSFFQSEDDIGKVLPLCFGTPVRVPAMELSLGPVGKLTSAITSNTTWYVRDGNPDNSKVTINTTTFHVTGFDAYHLKGAVTLEIDDTLFLGEFADLNDKTKFTCLSLGSFNTGHQMSIGIDSRPKNDSEFNNANCFYHSGTVDLKGKYVLIKFVRTYYQVEYTKDGAKVKDKISYSALNKLRDLDGNVVEGDTETKHESFVAQIVNHDIAMKRVFLSKPCVDRYQHPILLGEDLAATITSVKGRPDYDWEQLPSDSDAHEWIINPGTKVRIYNAGSLFIVNSVATNAIHEVVAKRQGVYQAVPSSYYTKELARAMTIDGKAATLTTIQFTKSLTQRYEEQWEGDQIYVTLTSSVGSNLVSEITPWIVTNRTTGLSVDTATKDLVGDCISKYPSHFAVTSQVDSIQALRSFSWQARVGMYIDAGIMYFKYLSKAPTTSVYTCTLDKIKMRSMKISKTETDNIHPKLTAYWQKTYVDEDRLKVIRENNKSLYKKNDYTMDFPIYNIRSLVEKSTTFWNNRLSNAWMHITIDTFLTSLAIQIWDNVTVSCPFINGGVDVIGTVDGIDFDTATHGIVLQVWLPICKGTGPAYLDDTLDVEPANPAVGLSEHNYQIPLASPRTRIMSSFKIKHKSYGSKLDQEEMP